MDDIPNGGHGDQDSMRLPTNPVQISNCGDVILLVQHVDPGSSTEVRHFFRVQSGALTLHSKYFNKMLSSGFHEGQRLNQALSELLKQYKSPGHIPVDELPVVTIQDIGRISAVKSIEALFADFLRVLHDAELQGAPSAANLANLAIVADRFDALERVAGYVHRKKLVRAIDGKTTAKADAALTEEKVRQRLLVALLLDYGPWLGKYSARLITKGWFGSDVTETTPLWWDLPFRLEEEVVLRRDCALETIQSLQEYYIRLYVSRDRQCKLGYDSSAQCDSFQLGEMLRFFSRIGTVRIKGNLVEGADEGGDGFTGDISDLIDSLKQVPEYQIDRNHSHCGIRTRMIPVLDMILLYLPHIGLCSDCWAEDRAKQMWINTKPHLLWTKNTQRLKVKDHIELHAQMRTMFTASERDWSG